MVKKYKQSPSQIEFFYSSIPFRLFWRLIFSKQAHTICHKRTSVMNSKYNNFRFISQRSPKPIVDTWYMKCGAASNYTNTIQIFVFLSIFNTKWTISWIYFQFIETWAISPNRQFGGHWHWNIFNDAQIFFNQLIRFLQLGSPWHWNIFENQQSPDIDLCSNRCDFYRPSLREASQKSLTLWKHSQNITALTFPIGVEGTYSLFLTLVCHSWTPLIVAVAKPHFFWGFYLRCPYSYSPLVETIWTHTCIAINFNGRDL